jgi:hypothetical protein
VRTVRDFIRQESSLERVIFCCFSERDLAVYRKALE